MRCGILVSARIGVQFAEQAVGGEQSEGLAGIVRVGEGGGCALVSQIGII